MEGRDRISFSQDGRNLRGVCEHISEPMGFINYSSSTGTPSFSRKALQREK